MDNAQKAIMLGVGLFITIIVIAAVMAIIGIGQQLIGQGQTQLSGISGQLATQLRADYDNQPISGSQVKTLVTKFYNDNTIAVYVVTANKGFSANSTGDYIISGVDTIETANANAKSGTASSTTGFYRASAAELQLTEAGEFTVTTATGATTGATKFSENRGIQAITISDAMLESAENKIPMSTINSAVNTNSQFKSVLITNSDNGNIVGIVVIRYQ